MKLQPLLIPESIIKEIGDFKHIPVYPYTTRWNGSMRVFAFRDENDNSIEIHLQPVDLDQLVFNSDELGIPIDAQDNLLNKIRHRHIYGIGFVVNQSEKQGTVADQTLLLKILATIKEVVVDFINTFKIKVLVFASAGQTLKRDNINWVDNQKTRLFQRVAAEQLKELAGWKMKIIGGFTFVYDGSIENN